ncbi:MAG: 50S ribosomal protein L10 [Candidatus Methanofastidiosia archaeon]
MAHVSEAKRKEIQTLEELIEKFPVVSLVNIEGIAAKQLSKMRRELYERVVLRCSKNTLIEIALRNSKRKGLRKLSEGIRGGASLLVCEMNPFMLYRLLQKEKVPAPAKAGVEATKDVLIEAGDTGIPPGPLVGELQRVGVPAKIERGSIVVKKDHLLVKRGQIISEQVADVLTKLGIEPLEVGLDVLGVWEDGVLYDSETLHVDEDEIFSNFAIAYQSALNLSVRAAIPTKNSISYLLQKAYIEGLALALFSRMPNSKTIGLLLSKAHFEMLSLKAIIDKNT